MTDFGRPVRRRAVAGAVQGRRVVVILRPPDLVGFRLERTRRTYWLTAAACYSAAVRAEVLSTQRTSRRVRRGALA